MFDGRQHQEIQLDRITGAAGVGEQAAIGLSAERGFQHEVASIRDKMPEAVEDESSGFEQRPLRREGRKPARDLVSVDEVEQRQFARREALDEGRLPRTVRACDDVEGGHDRSVIDLTTLGEVFKELGSKKADESFRSIHPCAQSVERYVATYFP